MRHYCSLLFELFGAWLAHRARTEWAIPGEVEGALILKPQSIIETMPFILKFRISGHGQGERVAGRGKPETVRCGAVATVSAASMRGDKFTS